MNKAPMNFYEFEKQLNIIESDITYLGECYNVGFDMYERIKSIYNAPILLSAIFKDKDKLIEQWLFDRIYIEINSTKELYEILMEGYNTWLKEECSPEK